MTLSAEQEVIREHGRAARAMSNHDTPLSVCTILRDEEIYNPIADEEVYYPFLNVIVIMFNIRMGTPSLSNDSSINVYYIVDNLLYLKSPCISFISQHE